MIGQTGSIAPADRKLYALRDVTGTVESIPLIAASIMSKKLAEGIGSLVLDVKFGHGAFMKNIEDSRRLAQTMVGIGNAQKVKTEALLSDMNAPLGFAVGNALEVIECLETLKGRGPKKLEALSLELAARMVRLAGVAKTHDQALAKVQTALRSGQGLEKFRQFVEHQGGNPKAVDDYALMPLAPKRLAVTADHSGYVGGLQAEQLGRAAMLLGAGRDTAEDSVDFSVGLRLRVSVGDQIKSGAALAELFGREDAKLQAAAAMVREACAVSDVKPPEARLIAESIE